MYVTKIAGIHNIWLSKYKCYICKVYDPEAQPWLMRVGGKGGKKYKVRVEAFLVLSICGFSSLVE